LQCIAVRCTQTQYNHTPHLAGADTLWHSLKESCYTSEHVTSHERLCQVIDMHVSRHTNEEVMTQMRTCHVTRNVHDGMSGIQTHTHTHTLYHSLSLSHTHTHTYTHTHTHIRTHVYRHTSAWPRGLCVHVWEVCVCVRVRMCVCVCVCVCMCVCV